jgi:thiamine biosynthesis protein ThiS
MSAIEILVNGEPRRLDGPATASDLLQHLGLDPRMVVVELNRRIVRRPQLSDTALADGDAVELVHFVGGG